MKIRTITVTLEMQTDAPLRLLRRAKLVEFRDRWAEGEDAPLLIAHLAQRPSVSVAQPPPVRKGKGRKAGSRRP